MGITIHYSGKIADQSRIGSAIAVVEAAAQRRGWTARRFTKEVATVRRSANEREWEYTGPTAGVVITPHELCEPLCLEFDGDGVFEDFVKTQFAGPETHMAVVDLLHTLEPAIDSLAVVDEGEFWDSGDQERLARLIEDCNKQFAQHKQRNSALRGPIRLDDGRIVDLIEVVDKETASTKPWWRFW